MSKWAMFVLSLSLLSIVSYPVINSYLVLLNAGILALIALWMFSKDKKNQDKKNKKK